MARSLAKPKAAQVDVGDFWHDSCACSRTGTCIVASVVEVVVQNELVELQWIAVEVCVTLSYMVLST